MIFLTVVRYTEPNEKQWFEVELVCGQNSIVLPGAIMWTEAAARQRAEGIAKFAPEHFHYDPKAEFVRA